MGYKPVDVSSDVQYYWITGILSGVMTLCSLIAVVLYCDIISWTGDLQVCRAIKPK